MEPLGEIFVVALVAVREYCPTPQHKVELTFQDGVENTGSFLVQDTVLGSVSGENGGFLSLAGSRATRQTLTYDLERSNEVIGTGGEIAIAGGTTLFADGINLTNTIANSSEANTAQPTQFNILDSEILSASTDISVGFISLANVAVDQQSALGFDRLLSDVVELDGLDDTLHVIDLSFDPSLGLAELLRFDEDQDLWVNAILGNSNIDAFSLNPGSTIEGDVSVDGQTFALSDFLDDSRFDGSYAEYLASLEDGQGPFLGAFGLADGTAWAVIDHNSSFAIASAVPEPSALMLGLFSLALASLKRRRTV